MMGMLLKKNLYALFERRRAAGETEDRLLSLLIQAMSDHLSKCNFKDMREDMHAMYHDFGQKNY